MKAMKARFFINGLAVFITAMLFSLFSKLEISSLEISSVLTIILTTLNTINGIILGISTANLLLEIGDLIDMVEEIKNDKEN